MITTTECMTAEELLHMPEDGMRYELLQGELVQMSPAGFEHGTLSINITVPLAQYVRAHNLGKVCAAETGFKISTNPDTVRAPDCAFVRRERVEAVGSTDAYWPGAPDLAVEVVSPSDSAVQVQNSSHSWSIVANRLFPSTSSGNGSIKKEKVAMWLQAGTRMVLVVNPRKRTVTVHRSHSNVVLTVHDTLDGDDVVPGWRLPVREVFG